ncbi:MFS transporter [Apilactobacillus xinyiensis]|uniref:MFS transporter n=1 Tax=Apilactobacillus xinyiensis TaxID=2841032 RepID=UPI001C7D8D3D|nr:MFS transporter [Apilactobacillus xinyiensis]
MFSFIKSNKEFSKIAGINLLSRLGDRLFYTVMLTSASLVSQSNLAVAMFSISETVPILFSFILGNISDKKRNKYKILVKNSITRTIIFIIIGILFYQSLNLNLILIISLLNMFSGFVGNYSSSLITPFTKIFIGKDDIEKAQGIISITAQCINVLSTLIGSILLSFFISSTIAFINAVIFLIVLSCIFLISSDLKHGEKQIAINKNSDSIFQTILKNFYKLFSNRTILNDLFQLSLINGFFGGLTPMFVILIKQINVNTSFRPILIAALSINITIFMIIGNYLSSKIFIKLSNNKLNNLASLFIILIGIGFYMNNIYIVLLASSLIAFNLGIVSPRFTAKIIRSYAVESLGGIVTTVNSLLVLAPPVTGILFPLLSTFGYNFSYFAFILYGLVLILFSKIILFNKNK